MYLSRLDEGNDRNTLQSSNLGHEMPEPSSVTLFVICYFMAPASFISLEVLEAATYLVPKIGTAYPNAAILKNKCTLNFENIFLHIFDTGFY